MSRAYVRFDPAFFERKAIEQHYPLAAVAALAGCICLGESQTPRGHFRDERLLKALLGPAGRWVAYLIERGDLVRPKGNGQLYLDGWEEWQEGDWQVKERMARVRNRKRADSSVDVTVPTVTSRPSGAGRGGAESGAGQPNRYSDAFKAFADITGKQVDETERKWINELCHDFGREVVASLMYEVGVKRGLLGKISRQLRKGAA